MSLLTSLLKGAEKAGIEDINKEVPELKKTVEKLKCKALTYIEKIYLEYSQKSNQSHRELLLKKALDVKNELSKLQEEASLVHMKDLVKVDYDLIKNIEELQNIDFSLKVVSSILSLDRLLITFNKELDQKNYLNCAKVLRDIETELDDTPLNEELDILLEFEHQVSCKKNAFPNELKNVITEFFNIQKFDKEPTVIKIRKNFPKVDDALGAAYFQDEDICVLHDIARSLWELFFVPIVESTVSLEKSEDLHYVNLTITILQVGVKSSYGTVFSNLRMLLELLLENFNKEISESLTTLEYIGNDIRDNLSELIIKSCLRDTIPNNADELQTYRVVIEDTKRLEESLLAANIFTKDTNSILAYANNVDILFIDKRCQTYLDTATDMMKKDLHDTEEVGSYYPNLLDPEPSEFPGCAISKNVPKLLKLGEDILEEAVNAPPEYAGRLFCIVQNIILKYITFVPEYHKNYLQTLPQQIALFHNNCLYIAHVANEWNVKYCAKLKPVLCSCDLSSEIMQLPLVASEIFSGYIEGQVKQVIEIMTGAKLNGPTLEKLDPKTEKCVRQCLRQQELLKTVWHKVLSYPDYNKNLGVIVDALCKCIIKSVVKFKDINAEAAAHLGEVIKLILTRAPKLFTNPEEVPIFVSSWYKLNELRFLLDASLLDIEDRWANGKGPLGLQFERAELKEVIKALFQNTDRRAAFLARI